MIWVCGVCRAEAPERLVWCPFCTREGSYGPRVMRTAYVGAVRTVSTRALYGATARSEVPAAWRPLLGAAAGSYVVLVHGVPGSGKSTLALRAAHEVYESAVYWSVEEGDGPALVARLRRLELQSDAVHVVVGGNLPDVHHVVEELRAGALFVDSVSAAAVTGQDVSGLSRALAVPVWALAQATKGGDSYRGPANLAHLADVVIRAVAYEGMTWKAVVEKSRFGPTGEVALG